MEQKKVSVILPTYNGAKYIRQAINSCLEQTYRNIELIIVDDNSSDGTDKIINSYSDQRIIYLKHGKNMGLPTALNTGFRMSSGDFLTWQSDDNFLSLNAIEKMVRALDGDRSASFVYANFYFIDEKGSIFQNFRVKSPKSLDIGNYIGPCFLYRRNVYEKIGDYNPKFELVEDYEYLLRIRQKFKMKRINDFLCYYRRHSRSLTSLNKATEIAERAEKASSSYVSSLYARYYQRGLFYEFRNLNPLYCKKNDKNILSGVSRQS